MSNVSKVMKACSVVVMSSELTGALALQICGKVADSPVATSDSKSNELVVPKELKLRAKRIHRSQGFRQTADEAKKLAAELDIPLQVQMPN